MCALPKPIKTKFCFKQFQPWTTQTQMKINCFEIKTVNQEVFAFSGKTGQETQSWLDEFANFKKHYEKK